jgi:hypothetical protein
MPILTIVKKYNRKSPLNGIVVSDKVTLESRDALTNFLAGVQHASQHGGLDWDIIDYSWAIGDGDVREILANPTGGRTGKI